MSDKSKKQIQLEWAIIGAGYIIMALIVTVATTDWRIGVSGLILCGAYSWGWYRCWSNHGIGWKEDQEDVKLIEESNEETRA